MPRLQNAHTPSKSTTGRRSAACPASPSAGKTLAKVARASGDGDDDAAPCACCPCCCCAAMPPSVTPAVLKRRVLLLWKRCRGRKAVRAKWALRSVVVRRDGENAACSMALGVRGSRRSRQQRRLKRARRVVAWPEGGAVIQSNTRCGRSLCFGGCGRRSGESMKPSIDPGD